MTVMQGGDNGSQLAAGERQLEGAGAMAGQREADRAQREMVMVLDDAQYCVELPPAGRGAVDDDLDGGVTAADVRHLPDRHGELQRGASRTRRTAPGGTRRGPGRGVRGQEQRRQRCLVEIEVVDEI